MRNLLYKLICWWYKFVNYPSILLNHVVIGNNVKFRGKVYFKVVGHKTKGKIVIGENVNINSSLSSNPIGGDIHTIIYTRPNGSICIGNNVGISNATIVSETKVIIGDHTNIGGGTKIYDTDFHSLNPHDRLNGDCNIKSKPVVIGQRVFIGGHSIILKGVTIGDNAVIGAGSVVTKDVPSNEIWAGNPARYIKTNSL